MIKGMPRRLNIILIIMLAVLVRIGAVLYVDTLHQPQSEDQAIAQSLADGQGFSFQQFNYFGPTSIRPPVYPFLLAGISQSFGSGTMGLAIAIGLNLLACGLSVWIAFLIGLNLFNSQRAALALAVLVAFWPTQIVAAAYLQGLVLANCFFLLSIYFITSCDNGRMPLAGLCAGLAVLTESILLLPVAAIYLWISTYKPNRAMIALAASICIVFPWIYRNMVVHDSLTGVTNTLWTDIYLGNGPGASGSQHLNTLDYSGRPNTRLTLAGPIEIDQLKKQTETRRSEIFQLWSTDWIKEHLSDYFLLSFKRIIHAVWMDWNHPRAWNLLNVIPRTLGFAAFFVAVALRLRHRKRVSRTIDEIPMVDPLETVDQFFQQGKSDEPGLKFNPVALSTVIVMGLIASSAMTLSEARNAVFLDIAQLLAMATLVDTKRET